METIFFETVETIEKKEEKNKTVELFESRVDVKVSSGMGLKGNK